MEITWTPEMDAILGTDRDAAIAGKLNLYGHQVVARRKVLGIPGYAVEPKEWTPEEDAVLGTDSLVKISAQLGRPTSQIQKRMKQLGIQSFGPSVTPRSQARIEKERQKLEQDKAAYYQRMQRGADVANGLAKGKTLTATAQELGISLAAARHRFFKFLRLIKHPSRLGKVIPAGDWQNIPSDIYEEAVRRSRIEIKQRDPSIWNEPLSGEKV